MFRSLLLLLLTAVFWGLYVLAIDLGVEAGELLQVTFEWLAVSSTAVLIVSIVGQLAVMALPDHAEGEEVTPITQTLIYGVLGGVATGAVLAYFGQDLGLILTTSALVAAIVGFALQETLANIIAGVALQMERHIRPGVWLRVDDDMFRVESTGWRSVTGLKPDNMRVLIPNTSLSLSNIKVFPEDRPLQHEFEFSGPLTCPPQQMQEIIADVVSDMPRVVVSKPVIVSPLSMDLSLGSIQYRVRYSIYTYDEAEDIAPEVLQRVWYAFQRYGFDLPGTEAGSGGLGASSSFALDEAALRSIVPSALGDGETYGLDADALMAARESSRVLLFAPQERITVPAPYAEHVCVLVSGEVSVGGGYQALNIFGARAKPYLRELRSKQLLPYASLSAFAEALAEEIGPLAERRVRDLARTAPDLPTLFAEASELIADAEQRAKFLATWRQGKGDIRGPGLVFTVSRDITGHHHPDEPLRAIGQVAILAVPRAALADGEAEKPRRPSAQRKPARQPAQ
jgi:small-conductance mechanosensitive channel